MNSIKKLVNSITNKYKEVSPRRRVLFTSRVTLTGNFLMAISKILLGITSFSIFFIISGFFSLGIGICKTIYIIGEKKSNGYVKNEFKYYFLIAITLLISSIFYITYMVRFFFVESSSNFGMIISIAVALVSFLEITIAIIGLTKSNKRKDLLLSGLKCVDLSSAFTALVTTQAVLLEATKVDMGLTTDYSVYNALTGVLFGMFSLIISILMIINVVIKENKELKKY